MKKTFAVLAVCLAATFGTTQNASAQGTGAAAVGSLGGLSTGAAAGLLAALIVVAVAAGGSDDSAGTTTTTSD